MSLWRRATDVASLRKWARVALVGMVAAVLISQVTGATAQVIPTISCTDRCNFQFKACDSACQVQLKGATATCAVTDAICEITCVLNGAEFGPVLAACVKPCRDAEDACLNNAAGHFASCESGGCQFSLAVCNLVCQFFNPG